MKPFSPAFIMSYFFHPSHRLLALCQPPQFYQTLEGICALQSHCEPENWWLHDFRITIIFFIVYIRSEIRISLLDGII